VTHKIRLAVVLSSLAIVASCGRIESDDESNREPDDASSDGSGGSQPNSVGGQSSSGGDGIDISGIGGTGPCPRVCLDDAVFMKSCFEAGGDRHEPCAWGCIETPDGAECLEAPEGQGGAGGEGASSGGSPGSGGANDDPIDPEDVGHTARSCGSSNFQNGQEVPTVLTDCTQFGDVDSECVFSNHCWCTSGFRCEGVEADPGRDPNLRIECDYSQSCVPN
jgi:hypothetical protein